MSDLKKIFTNSLMVEISVNENTMEMLTKEKRKESHYKRIKYKRETGN